MNKLFQQQICLWSALFFIAALTNSCNNNRNNIKDNEKGNNYGIVTIAKKFSLEKTDSCTVLKIKDPWQGAAGIEYSYYLINRDSDKTLKIDPSEIIYVPVRKIICMSTTHVAMIAALDERNTIAGVSVNDFVYDEKISAMIKEGLVGNVGYESGLNNELILSIDPDLIMFYGVGSESAGHAGKLRELGTQAIFNADYLEEDPLAKAEWIKLYGALYCKEEMADSIFTSVFKSYNQIKEYVRLNSVNRPDVLLGLPFRDVWYVSPGNSYISTLISDAGGNYLWKGTESSVSMPFGLEDIFIRAVEADYWLNIGTAKSKKEVYSIDQRFAKLPCYSNDNLYNNNKRMSPKGGNDYWESGAIHPELILKDIAAILHPGLFGDWELYYYRKLD